MTENSQEIQHLIYSLDAAFTSARSKSESNALIREIFAVFLLLRIYDRNLPKVGIENSQFELSESEIIPLELSWRNISRLPVLGIAEKLSQLQNIFDNLVSKSHSSESSFLRVVSESIGRILKVNFVYLDQFFDWLNSQEFDSDERIDEALSAFDCVLEETADNYEGLHRTSVDVSTLVTAVADPSHGNSVYDPCFGFGNFLTKCWRYSDSSIKVYGVEKHEPSFLIGFTRLLLAGVREPKLRLGDSLGRGQSSNANSEGFDLIVLDPPVRNKIDREQLHQLEVGFTYEIKSRDSTGLFIQEALSLLKPSGKAVIVVPDSFLFQGGTDKELRRLLVERGHIEAVIRLPAGQTTTYSNLKCSLLILTKKGDKKIVRMADATSLFKSTKTDMHQPLLNSLARDFAQKISIEELPLQHPRALDLPDLPGTGVTWRSIWEVSRDELEKMEWDLTPKRRVNIALNRVLKDLEQHGMQVVQLGSVVEIFSGIHVRSAELTEHPFSSNSLGYVRIGDLKSGKIKRPTSWVRQIENHTEERKRLRPNDVLLSKSGTIGKSAIIEIDDSKLIASKGLFVLRPDPTLLEPEFLYGYFSSALVKSWLESQSKGAVIQHITVEALSSLLLPLPSLEAQRKVLLRQKEKARKAGIQYDFLVHVQSLVEEENEPHPLRIWTNRLKLALPKFVPGLDDVPSVGKLSSIATLTRDAKDYSSDEDYNVISGWYEPLIEGLKLLCDIDQLESNLAVLAIIDKSLYLFMDCFDQANEYGEDEVMNIAEILIDWLDALYGAYSNSFVSIVDIPNGIVRDDDSPLVIAVKVCGQIPLRNVKFHTKPDIGKGQYSGYSRSGVEIYIPLEAGFDRTKDKLEFKFIWSAETLFNREVSGEEAVSLIIKDGDFSEQYERELGGSPYVTGSPLEPKHGEDLFFGRGPVMEKISRQIKTQGNVVLLEGNRRAGKTSILKHLEGDTAIEGWLSVYASLQGAEGSPDAIGVPTEEVFRTIAIEIAKSLPKIGLDAICPNGQIFQVGKKMLGVARACREGITVESPFADFRDYLESVLDILEPLSIGLVLMLDEFDKLQEGIDSGVTSPQVPENIRFLIQTYPKFSAILTGSRRLKRLREEYWSALYGIGTSIAVTALDNDSARKVILVPVKEKLTFSEEAIRRIIELTAGQPYLLQCLCNRIFDVASESNIRSITISVVSEAAQRLVRDNEHFATLWDYAALGPKSGGNRRRLILLICAKNFKQKSHVSFGGLDEQLVQSGVEIDQDKLDIDLSYLRELELIEYLGEIGEGEYRLVVPLMADWIEQQQDVDVVASLAQTEAEEESD